MAQFKFKNNNIIFDIEGKVYMVTPEKAQKGMGFLGELHEEAAALAEKDNEAVVQYMNKCVSIIDDMLGETGATAKIFEGRTVNAFDLGDLIAYMAAEVTEFAERKKKEYAGK